MQGNTGTGSAAAGAPDRGVGVNETTAVLAMAIWFGPPLALALSLFLVALYRRAVRREMNRRSAVIAGGSGPRQRQLAPFAHAARPWREVRRRAGMTYVLGGLAYALVQSALFHFFTDLEVLPFRTLLITITHFWPFVLLLALFFAASAGARVLLFAGYFSVLMLPAVVADHWYDPLLFWAPIQAIATLLLCGFLWYRVRAVGPLSLAVVQGLIVGANAATFWLAGNQETAARAGEAVGVSSALVIVGAVLAAGAVPAVVVVVLLLRGLGTLYRDGRIGDQELTAEALVFTFCLSSTSDLVFAGRHGGYLVVGLLPFVCFVVVSRLLRRPVPGSAPAPSLLFLRVFAPPGSAARLWAVLGRSWRYHGSINMIGGPDLALSTLAPHRFLDFLAGRLPARFVHDTAGLDNALAKLDTGRDRDGRFAVNELYCGDSAWRAAFEALLPQSDVILMDLRGFTRARAGAGFELAALAWTGAIARTVLLVDRSTDRAFVNETIVYAAPASRGAARIIDLSSNFSEGSLMDALLQGASIHPLATGPALQPA